MPALTIQEHIASRFPRDALKPEQGTTLFQTYGKFIDVQFPSPRTGGQWELTSRGWIGALALDGDTTLIAQPKVPIASLATMIRMVFDLLITDFPRLAPSGSVLELYDQLAAVLARRALHLVRQGALQRYQPTVDELGAIRGRIDFRWLMARSAATEVRCHYSDRSADLLEHRIILWTVDRVLRSGLCSEGTQRLLRECHRQIGALAELRPVKPSDCGAVTYDRLSERYRPVIALCRMFLEGSAPLPLEGTTPTVPFLLSMPALFERFVARTLEGALPQSYMVRAQERSVVGFESRIEFFIDIVIYEASSGRPLCVLDTKYKNVVDPSAADVAQVGFYALLKGAPLAGLIFPVRVPVEWRGATGRVRTFRSTFDLERPVDAATEALLGPLIALLDEVRTDGAVLSEPGVTV